MRESARLQATQTPVIPVVGEMIRSTPGCISLGQGVVYYGPPPRAREAIERFFADPENHKYRPVQGIPPLLEAFAAKLSRENGIRVGQGTALVVTAGGNMAFKNALLAIADPGDEVILQTPYYFNHEMAVGIAGCRAVLVPTDPGFQLDVDRIADAIGPRTRAVVTISPNNPSGAVYPEDDLRAVNRLCLERGVFHIHDEAYEHFVYGVARHFSPGAISGSQGHTISLFSLSKSYGFAGWRIGCMAIPDRLLTAVKKVQDTILICPPVISQYAAVGALEEGPSYCLKMRREIEAVRCLLLESLEELGSICHVTPADGAFYVLVRVDCRLPAMELVERLIRDHGVGVLPGSTFGLDAGCWLRIAYGALEMRTAAEGIGRLVRGLRALQGG